MYANTNSNQRHSDVVVVTMTKMMMMVEENVEVMNCCEQSCLTLSENMQSPFNWAGMQHTPTSAHLSYERKVTQTDQVRQKITVFHSWKIYNHHLTFKSC